LLLPSSCRRCRCESCERDEAWGICGFAAGTVVVVVVVVVVVAVACKAAAAARAGRARGGRKGFFVAAEWGVLLNNDEDVDDDDGNGRGTVRVIPSARLDPCPWVCDGGVCAGINKVEAEDVDLLCQASESVIGTADTTAVVAVVVVAPLFRTSFTAGGSGVCTGNCCDCCE
jgi:hypothetical protein